MKKLIQLFSIFSVVAVFSIISANAQTVQRYEAKIPFDFNIGNKSYQAGDYVMKISVNPVGRILTIEDSSKQYLQQVLVTEQRGQVAKDFAELLFNRYDDQWSLAGLSTTERGFSIPALKSKKQMAAIAGFSADTVSVELK